LFCDTLCLDAPINEHYRPIRKPSFSVLEGENKRLIANHDPMGNYTSMKATIGLASGNIENWSIREPASRNEFCHDKEIITSSHLPVPAVPVEAGQTKDECVILVVIRVHSNDFDLLVKSCVCVVFLLCQCKSRECGYTIYYI